MSTYVENDLATYLAQNVSWLVLESVAGDTGAQNFFKGDLPVSPDEAAAIFEVQGEQSIYFLGDSPSRIERPRVMIRVRSLRYDRTRDLINQIYDALENKALTIGGVEYLMLRSVSKPTEENPDGQNRSVFSVGFMMWRQV